MYIHCCANHSSESLLHLTFQIQHSTLVGEMSWGLLELSVVGKQIVLRTYIFSQLIRGSPTLRTKIIA